ncbi:MAG: YggS family pyridoxal phosphate-dependent enzyme [Chloroflexi bacterium]|nr:YggS family pyridoxal phosphate-dependent enzyme [Chloroflexota bacterium]
MNELAQRYTAVLNRITAAAQRAGRSPEAVTLVAVSKTWPAETVLAAYEVGMRHFGENRPEELAAKRTAVEAALGPDNGIIWHQIGTLQSRKTGLTAVHADVFHALDRLKIANRLAREVGENGRILPTFLEVNVSGETSKSGFDVSKWQEDATQQARIRTIVQALVNLPALSVHGLMTMAPWQAPEDEIRAVFRQTRLLAHWLNQVEPALQLTGLSMGMTDDFEIAIEEGATHVRVGRALFGTRT